MAVLAGLAGLASWYGMPEPFRAVGLMGVGMTLGPSESSLTNNRRVSRMYV
jgi:hypothetical protein